MLSSFCRHRCQRHVCLALCLLVALSPFAGCASSPTHPTPAPIPATPPFDPTPAVRYGRYTLIELVAESPQRDLMQQIIDVTIPASVNASVGDAMRYLLLRTGYQLCETPDIRRLDALPLPAAHIHLGPVTLRDALQLLAGATGQLHVDDSSRTVCFSTQHPAVDQTAGVPASSAESRP